MANPPPAREFELIARYFAPLAKNAPLAFSLTDDAAALRPRAGRDLVLTTDTIIAGVHFLPDDAPRAVAKKLLRVNLSDLAAKGAVPVCYLLNSSFPRDVGEDWIADFARGLAEDQAEFGITLLGGDTTATPGPPTFSLTAIGEVPKGGMIRRAGARAGDEVWVTGTIGDGLLGLRIARGEDLSLPPTLAKHLSRRYRVPEPRAVIGPRLIGIAKACLDVSDGLVADLGHLCAASSVGAAILAEAVPLSPAGRRAVVAGRASLGELLTGGDDYELVFAVSPRDEPKLARAVARTGVKATKIGRIVRGRGVEVLGEDGRPLALPHAGYAHF